MPTALGVFAVGGILIVSLLILFLIQSLIAPRLIYGTLSEPRYQPCNIGKQWVLYDCLPNAITGLGCIVPGSDDELITYKTIAVENPSCIPQSDGETAGERVISWVWQEQGSAGVCTSQTGSTGCCNFTSNCSRTVTYLCVRTAQSIDGENQCTPTYLPAPYPEFNALNFNYSVTPVLLQVPCRENYCTS